MQVMKFGGTSVNDAKAIAQVVAIVADQLKTDPNVVVVTSAMRGVTDLLIDSANAAARATGRSIAMRGRPSSAVTATRPRHWCTIWTTSHASRRRRTNGCASSSGSAWPSPSWAS